mmetsp:Transcript_58846/g.170212  ORF Transcript_58846/g.170212 Transcript_58846/m.170212 type:complete len:665 (-) Transcript_58846:89-2083(-)
MAITGVIRPPPEIRAVADRTASYVAKNGRTFEARILKSAKGKTPKFAFLQPTSPFHAYYEDRIKFYENGGEDNEEEAKQEEKKEDQQQQPESQQAPKEPVARKTEKTQVASAIDPIAKALLAQRAKISQLKAEDKEQDEAKKGEDGANKNAVVIPPPPPLDLVTIVAPANLSPAQMEIIQLVAQFAALDGKGGTFLHQLSVREWNNSEFSFCQPRHAHFAYFSALVDAYRKIISEWTAAANDKSEAKVPSKVDKADALQSVLEEAAYRAEYEREVEQQRSQREDGEVIAIDWHDFVVVETIDFPVDEKVELSMLPPPPPAPTTTTTAKAPANDEMEESDDDDDEGEAIRVVPSYTPKVVGTANPQTARAIDPITRKSVSVADVPEHLRIQLLDPKWAEERKKFQDKQKESNLVAGDAIVNNLSKYSQARGDLFGKSEQELLDKEKDSKRRLEEANRIIRDQAIQPPPGFAAQQGSGETETGAGQSMEPDAKRMRMDNSAAGNVSIPPPPPPPPTQQGSVPPPPPSVAPSGMEPSGNPMADALLNAGNTGNSDNTGTQLLSEADFAASLPKPEITLQIRIPNDPTQMAWNFYGQILSLTINVMSTIKEVKSELSRLHLNGMPVNKIQLKDPASGFYNNNNASLASLNIGPTATMEMLPKSRGGRR